MSPSPAFEARSRRAVLPALTVGSVLAAAASFVPAQASGQWTNRYPKVAGYSHHVYLEGYELPTLTNGPIDPAPSPDGATVAVSHRGWIWLLDLETGRARQVTSGGDMDFRPAWHPDGDRLVFVRDTGSDTRLVLTDRTGGAEEVLVDTPALDLDPAFAPDGRTLYFVSGAAGDLDIWALDMESREQRRVTDDDAIEMRPQPLPGDAGLVLLSKGIDQDRVELRPAAPGSPTRVLLRGSIWSQSRPATSPDGTMMVVNQPTQDGWELRLHGLADPGVSILLATGLPLTPAWGPDGAWIYFSEAGEDQVMTLERVAVNGGPVEILDVRAWEPAGPEGVVRVSTVREGTPIPVRMSASDASGHPVFPERGAVHFDGQNGRVFFYSDGLVELRAAAGPVTISAVQGLATPEVSTTVTVTPGRPADVSMDVLPVWDAQAGGWTSGDHHFHLNYGGPYDLDPSALLPRMAGEDLDMGTPLLANLHNRFEDQDLWGWESAGGGPRVRFGQEIRSHFLGHLGLMEIQDLHWPWIWGPGYQVYGTDDRTNGEVLSFGRGQGGLGYYVHPIMGPDPFAEENLASGPVELVVDAVLGDVDALEVVCLWSDERGTADLWHRLLSVGIPVAPSAGTDVMTDFYRTMAVGTTRVYARTGDATGWPAYVSALAEGRSFVTNGPFLDFAVNDAVPGDALPAGEVTWTLDVSTATDVDTVEVLVNGEVVWSGAGPSSSGSEHHTGQVDLPGGGWIAARAHGGPVSWPSMDSYPFAHTGPVWIGSRGSTDPDARRRAAGELLRMVLAQRERLIDGFAGAEIPRLLERFDRAEARLRAWVDGG